MTVYAEMYTMDKSGNYPSSPTSGGGTMIISVTGDDGTDCGSTTSSTATASHRNNNGDPWWNKWKGVAKVKTKTEWSSGNFVGETGFSYSHINCSGCGSDLRWDSYDDAKHGLIHTHSISNGIWDTVGVTFKYYFSRNTYAITLDANGGLCAQGSKSVYYKAQIGTLPTPVRSGYQFLGWGTSSSGATMISHETYTVTGALTLYARWSENYVTLSLDASSGSIPSTTGWTVAGSSASKKNYSFASYGTLPNPVRTGYTFLGWSKNLLNIYDYADFINSKTDRTDMSYVNFSSDGVLNMNPTQNYHLVNGSQEAYLFPVILPVAGRYRLSYYAYNDRTDTNIAGAFRISTSDSSVTAVSETNTINSQTRKKYIGLYDVSVATGVNVYFSWHYAGMCHLDNIVLELISPSNGWPSGAFATSTTTHTASEVLTAQWSINTYTLTINYHASITNMAYLTVSSQTGYIGGITVTPGSQSMYSRTYTVSQQEIYLGLSYNAADSYYMRIGSTPTTALYNKLFTNNDSSYYTYKWAPVGNSTIDVYVYQRYTISYYANNGTGTVPFKQYKIYGTSVSLASNLLTRTSYLANGWNTTASGTGTAYIETALNWNYSVESSVLLYADWTPIMSTINIKIMTSTDGSSFTNSVTGGTATLEYYYDSLNNPKKIESAKKISSASDTTQVLSQQTVTIRGMANNGYRFVGITSSSTTPPYSSYGSSLTPSGNSSYTRYIYFVKDTNNTLKYDSTDKYFYFEDGYFPQSYVGDALNATLNSATLDRNLKYLDASGSTVSIPIYTYSGEKYAKVQKNNVTKWFKVEKIRWRVSEYGVSSSGYASKWAYGKLNTNFKVVSDRVLWVGAITRANTKEGWRFNESNMRTYFSEIYQKNGASVTDEIPNYASTGYAEKNYYYGPAGQQEKVKYTSASYSGINIATEEEIKENLTDLRARASDMVAFILGLNEDSYCDYWTRELGGSLKNGKMITNSGITKSAWLQNFYGVRFSLRMSEGSRV